MNISFNSYSIFDNLSIHDNTIVNSRRGIYTLQVNLNNIYSNTITSTSASSAARVGIWVESGANNRIDCNNVTFGGIAAPNVDICIHIKSSQFNRIRKNRTNSAKFGIMFFGNCKTPNNVWGNIMDLHDKYITITNGGEMGAQYTAVTFPLLPGNQFLNTGGRDRLYSRNSSNGTLSPYRYKSTGFASYVGTPSNVDFPSSLVITPVPRPSPNPYTWSGACGAPLPRLADSTEVDTTLSNEAQKIAYDPIDAENQSLEETTAKYQAKGNIYEQLKLDSIVVDWTDSLDLFIAEYPSTEAYELKDIKEELLNGELENAKYKLLNVASSVYAEEQLKLVLEWQTDTIVPDTGITKFAALEAIAYQCPNEGGEAVFIARSELMKYYDYIHWDDMTICDPQTSPEYSGARRANPDAVTTLDNNAMNKLIANPSNSNNTNLLLYPNPSNEYISIHNLSDTSILQVNFIAMNGEIAKSYDTTNASKFISINIKEMNKGIYLVNIIFENGSTKIIKLEIN